jgi:hypothetical protein
MPIQTPPYAIRTRRMTVTHLMRSGTDQGAAAGAGVAIVICGAGPGQGPPSQSADEDVPLGEAGVVADDGAGFGADGVAWRAEGA